MAKAQNNTIPRNDEREEKEEIFSHAMQLIVMSNALPMSLKSAMELGVFDIIAKAGEGAELSSAEIAAKLANNTNPEAPLMLDRILRLLASHSVLSCSVVGDENGSDFQRLYGLTPVSKYYATDEDGVSLVPMMALCNYKNYLVIWQQLSKSILEGGSSFNEVHGAHAIEFTGVDPEFNNIMNTAMYNHTIIATKNILEVYKGFESVKKLVDVGGAQGTTLKIITTKYPHIKAINFDMPHVIKDAPSYPGVEHVGGDMFESVPEGDAIFVKWVLLGSSDEDCIKLLKNCYKAIPDDGKVIVVESILPVRPETNYGVKYTSLMDVIMMTQYTGGKERSRQDFQALATAAGFGGINFQCFVSNFWVMEFVK